MLYTYMHGMWMFVFDQVSNTCRAVIQGPFFLSTTLYNVNSVEERQLQVLSDNIIFKPNFFDCNILGILY